MHVEKDFEDLLRLFKKHKVKYCIVGAYAVAFYAKPRYTKDLDLFVKPDLNNSRRVIQALNEFGFLSLKLSEDTFAKPHTIIQLGFEPVRIDILTSLSGVPFDSAWKHRKRAAYGALKVMFIGKADLIKNKKASKRTQDLADLEFLVKKSKS